MMRYHQRVSPDGLPLSNGKRSNSNSSEGKGLPRFRSPSKTQDQNLSNFDSGGGGGGGGAGGGVPSSPAQSDNNHQHQQQYEAIPTRTNSPGCNGGGGGDVLLQWGQRKRSRCSRTDVRVAAVVANEESSSSIQLQSRQPIKVQRRLMQPNPTPGVVVVDKLSTTTTTTIDRPATPPPPPPPLPSSVNSTAPLSNGKKSSAIFANRKSLEERCGGVVNGANGSNTGGSSRRVVSSRSAVGKRSSPTLAEKFDRKAPPTGSSRDQKWNGATFEQAAVVAATTAAADDMNHIDSAPPQPEQQAGFNDHNRNNTGNGTVTGGEKANGEVVEWPRIYIPLTRKEKEEDFLAMKGTKLPHRPKKRPKTIERILQYCFPGMWLSDLTRGRYEVREKKCAKKQKRRGLKGMESMDSDSE